MVTNKIMALEVLKGELDSVKAEILRVAGDEGISKNTKHTKTYNLRKEQKRLYVIHALISKLPEEALAGLQAKDKVFNESLGSILNPETGGSTIHVEEGKTLLALLQEYKDARDAYARIMKAAEKSGLKLDKDGITFVRA